MNATQTKKCYKCGCQDDQRYMIHTGPRGWICEDCKPASSKIDLGKYDETGDDCENEE